MGDRHGLERRVGDVSLRQHARLVESMAGVGRLAVVVHHHLSGCHDLVLGVLIQLQDSNLVALLLVVPQRVYDNILRLNDLNRSSSILVRCRVNDGADHGVDEVHSYNRICLPNPLVPLLRRGSNGKEILVKVLQEDRAVSKDSSRRPDGLVHPLSRDREQFLPLGKRHGPDDFSSHLIADLAHAKPVDRRPLLVHQVEDDVQSSLPEGFTGLGRVGEQVDLVRAVHHHYHVRVLLRQEWHKGRLDHFDRQHLPRSLSSCQWLHPGDERVP
mmetsp:Transcript_52421/g.162689  ORF Transcript_52421/g.162689 Transcript_52421/m.162689 type:complete len:271 (-) Transcript_52421:1776-2588(-)